MPNNYGFKRDYKHRELDSFAFDKGISPRNRKPSFAWLYLIIGLLFILAFLIAHATHLTDITPVAHADTVQVPMTDLQTYRFWDKNTKSLCQQYLNNH